MQKEQWAVMKKAIILIIVMAVFFTAFSTGAKASVIVQVASTHAPTKEFQVFIKEFLSCFEDLCATAAPVFYRADYKVFLIERRDKGWWIGLCEPNFKEINPALGFVSAELSFNPLWVIEGKRLKNKKELRALAREAAEFLFRKVSQRVV